MRFMWPAQVITLIALLLVLVINTRSLPAAAPFLLAWLLSPLIAFYVSRHRTQVARELAPTDVRAGRIIARRTWRFFETFVTDEDNWLPPDNFQEDPEPTIALRTSPTLAAYDFGYVGLSELIERIEMTFASLVKLQKFRGHFLNWYDTRTLAPLWPQYISVVDSGNLAGNLLTLRQACIELPDQKLFDERVLRGMADTVAAIKQETSQLTTARRRTDALTIKQLQDEINGCARLLAAEPPNSLAQWANLFDSLTEHASVTDDIVAALAQEHGRDEFTEIRWWTSSLLHEARGHQRDLHTLAPWGANSPAKLSLLDQNSEARRQWELIASELGNVPSLTNIPQICDRVLVELAAFNTPAEQNENQAENTGTPKSIISAPPSEQLDELTALTTIIEQAAEAAKSFSSRLAGIA